MKELFNYLSGLLLVSILFGWGSLARAQDSVTVSGYDYVRYGERIGLLGDRFIAFVPSDYDSTRKYRIIWLQHGAGGDPESVNFKIATDPRNDDAIIIAPHLTVGEWRFVDSSITSTQQVFEHLHKIRRDYNTYEKVTLMGFSMGGQFAAAFGLRFPEELMLNQAGGFGNGYSYPDGTYFWALQPQTRMNFNFDVDSYFEAATKEAYPTYDKVHWQATCGLQDAEPRLLGAQDFARKLVELGVPKVDTVWPNVGHTVSDEMRNLFMAAYAAIDNNNAEPEAQATISSAGGLTVSLDASQSADTDGSIDRYRWWIPGRGYIRQAQVQHTFPETGTYLVKLQVFDNDNDRNTLWKSITVEAGNVQVNNPPETYPVKVQSQFNGNYDFKDQDFNKAFNDKDQDQLTKIKIISLPLKGDLFFHGKAVQIGQEIGLGDIKQLTYQPLAGNSGEDFFEYNAHDGHSWSPYEDSRAIISIGKAQPVLFDSVETTTSNTKPRPRISVGLDSSSLYFVNEQSALTEVSQGLKGAEFVRTHSGDKNETETNTLRVLLNQPATVYIAHDGRSDQPPNWLKDDFEFVDNRSLKSWFYFDLYKKQIDTPGWVSLDGNNATGAINTKSMYFVIGVPLNSNRPPEVSDGFLELDNPSPFKFSTAFFDTLYTDFEQATMQKVRIEKAPEHATLKLNGTPITEGDSVESNQLTNLVLEPNVGYSGLDHFRFVAADGEQWAKRSAKINLTLNSVTRIAERRNEARINLFPNPAKSEVFVEGYQGPFSILSVNGQSIMQGTLHNEEAIPLNNLPKGLYLLQLHRNHTTLKLILE
jgi:pimeloyl-ACP methyl ester carboxylesterase